MKMLKTLDTIGNCQRLVFTVGVSQDMQKNNKPVKIWKLHNYNYYNLQNYITSE